MQADRNFFLPNEIHLQAKKNIVTQRKERILTAKIAFSLRANVIKLCMT